MALQKPLTNFAAYIDGETEAQKLIKTLADQVVNADIPRVEGGIDANRWESVYESDGYKWVTYQKGYNLDVVGMYEHTDGNKYEVFKVPNWTDAKIIGGDKAVDADGYLHEVELSYFKEDAEGKPEPVNTDIGKDFGNYRTGRKIQVVQFSYTDGQTQEVKYVDVPGCLITVVVDDTTPVGYKAYLVQQTIDTLDGATEPSSEWNQFEIVVEMPSDWAYAVRGIKNGRFYYNYSRRASSDAWGKFTWGTITETYYEPNKQQYKFNELNYKADLLNSLPSRVVIKGTPTVPSGIPSRDYYVMFEQPVDDWNYINVYHGEGFDGSMAQGDPKLTYEGIVDPDTLKLGVAPTVIDQLKAHYVYLSWNDPNAVKEFVPPVVKWKLDYDGVTEIVSPAAHFFHGRDSTTAWLPNKKRRPDYLISYTMSVNNDRIVLVIEGDPSPNIHGYYRSFGYIGKIVPFNEYDHAGNFGVTVGMGDLRTDMTGYTKNDVITELNPDLYAKYGEYTSNGMDSMSMLKTRSNVLFQRYYPAFITHLPNYPSVGTLPPGLSKLIVDADGFQKSLWTGKYHASPIYLVHQAEGYRGYMDGVVAIHDHNLVNRDELIVDTEILKDTANPSLGTWTEVYKFFSIKSPLNLFKHSPSPDVITIAFLKEIK
ncbi:MULTISPECIES: hypothetical protein [unclassified Paenibacillus]|uniref:hypothetical protein n=1 Tax=unclassified Paenibacillus TaxID=185978 RepID=UPI0008978198|nr:MULTISPECIES: hypothetical protein [unclassified Paenibacillus]OMC68644.1 hypothetical protein BK126_12510 [Paenibacillus sp. FSL H7-0326]SDW56342.1 hypothetical protein SAMN05518848_102191 [Paenibacillus sp. PDC88]